MFKNVSNAIHEFGFLGGTLYLADRIVQKFSPELRVFFYEMLIQPIPEKPLLSGKLAQTFQIREIRRGDPEVEMMPARPDIKELRFAQNAICLGAFKNDKLVGYVWLCFNRYEEDEVRCTFVLPAHGHGVFDFDIYIFPEYRLTLGFVGVWNGANQYLRSKGITNSFSRLTRTNVASRRAHKHLGASRISRVVILKLWAVELLFTSTAPYFHISLTRGNRARMKLRDDVTKATLD